MPATYRPSLLGASAAGAIFLLFLIIGLYSGFYWWFILWCFILLPLGADYSYYVIYVEDDPPKVEDDKVAETDNLLPKNNLNF